jgi:hypothetical protein
MQCAITKKTAEISKKSKCKTTQAMYVQRNIEARSRIIVAVEKQ